MLNGENRILVWFHIRIHELITKSHDALFFLGFLFLMNIDDKSSATAKSGRIEVGNSGTVGDVLVTDVAAGVGVGKVEVDVEV